MRLTTDELATLAGDGATAETIRSTIGAWVQVAAVSADADSAATLDDLDDARRATLESLLTELDAPGRDDFERGLDGGFICIRAIPLSADNTAESILAEIADGLSFADAAAEYSAVESLAVNGGIVTDQSGQTCLSNASLDASFPQLREALVEVGAEVGVPTSIADPGGEIVILLRPYDDLDTIERVTVGQTELSAAIAMKYDEATIWIASRYGSWDPESGTIVVRASDSDSTDGLGN